MTTTLTTIWTCNYIASFSITFETKKAPTTAPRTHRMKRRDVVRGGGGVCRDDDGGGAGRASSSGLGGSSDGAAAGFWVGFAA